MKGGTVTHTTDIDSTFERNGSTAQLPWEGKTDWDGDIADYPLERYPDYVPGLPAQAYKLEEFSYQDELVRVWGKPWGSQGIGKLRETVLSMPTENEINGLWARAPEYFLLRHQLVTGRPGMLD